MTATRGAGFIRFTMPRSGRVVIAVAFDRGYSTRLAARWRERRDGDLQARFSAGTVCDAGAYHLHSATRLWHDGVAATGGWQGEDTGTAHLSLAVRRGDRIELWTGLSSVDPAAAARVRAIELGERSFDAVAAQTLRSWNRELSRISLAGTPKRTALFYTSLFRVMQTPVAIADPDGRFRGSDGMIARIPIGEQHYASWALWDNYRTQMPLLALVDPGHAGQIVRSLVRLYRTGKQRWATGTEPFPTVRTEQAGIVLLDFRRKGIVDFDARAALTGMIAESATLARKTPDEQIEAACDDWAVAELASDLGETATAAEYRAQALSYRTMWLQTFRNPGADADVVHARGLYQGTLAQYRWAPVFDLPWLAETLGARFRPELERFFADNLFNMTNQPDIHVPYLFAWAGDRAMTDRIVRRYVDQAVAHRYTNAGVRPVPWVGHSFALAPRGFADGMDDDAGTMSAWYIWSVLGCYPLTPGKPGFVRTTPMVRDVRIRGAPLATMLLPSTSETAR